MTAPLPALLAAPPPGERALWLRGARVFDGIALELSEPAGVLVRDGRIAAIEPAASPAPEGAVVVDLAGRTLMPGLIDAHAHLISRPPEPAHGAEPIHTGAHGHFLAADLREALARGITTMRDVGSFGGVVEARQAMRYGAFRGPRVLTCGRIISPTGPGGRFFAGMYREADGPDDVRRAVREQLRGGADYLKVMTTGARSVELEDPGPAQLTSEELEALVDEAHRMGYRVAAHAEGLGGTELAVLAGVDTIEHGQHLHERPDLLERMASAGQVLIPTLSSFAGVADENEGWSAPLQALARRNLEHGERTLGAARLAGVPIALGHDWNPIHNSAVELERMIAHGLPTPEALRAATATAARALALSDHVGTIEPGKLADLLVLDGDPLADPALLRSREAIWLVLQLGEPVAGRALVGDSGRPG